MWLRTPLGVADVHRTCHISLQAYADAGGGGGGGGGAVGTVTASPITFFLPAAVPQHHSNPPCMRLQDSGMSRPGRIEIASRRSNARFEVCCTL